MERVSKAQSVGHRTFDELLQEELRDSEVASNYLALALNDGAGEIMSRIAEMIRAGVNISSVDSSLIDRVNEQLATAHVPIHWRKAA